MLVLTRKKSEEIFIELPDGSLVVITVAEIRKDKVRIGVEADRSVQIYRREVYERLQQGSELLHGEAGVSDQTP